MSRFKTYTQFVNAVKSLLAIEEIHVTEAGWINYSLNSRLEEAREAARWPDIVKIEARTPVSGVIDWAQADEVEIGKVWGVYNVDPNSSSDIPSEVQYAETEDGIKLKQNITGDVWVVYTPAYEELDSADIYNIEIPKYLFNYCVWGTIADYWYGRGNDISGERADTKALREIIRAKKSLFTDQKQKNSFIIKTAISEKLD